MMNIAVATSTILLNTIIIAKMFCSIFHMIHDKAKPTKEEIIWYANDLILAPKHQNSEPTRVKETAKDSNRTMISPIIEISAQM